MSQHIACSCAHVLQRGLSSSTFEHSYVCDFNIKSYHDWWLWSGHFIFTKSFWSQQSWVALSYKRRDYHIYNLAVLANSLSAWRFLHTSRIITSSDHHHFLHPFVRTDGLSALHTKAADEAWLLTLLICCADLVNKRYAKVFPSTLRTYRQEAVTAQATKVIQFTQFVFFFKYRLPLGFMNTHRRQYAPQKSRDLWEGEWFGCGTSIALQFGWTQVKPDNWLACKNFLAFWVILGTS